MQDRQTSPAPLDYASPQRRTVSGELGKFVRGVTFLFSLVRPFVFAIGCGFLMYGLGASIQGHYDGPTSMAIGGVLVGISIPWWRVEA